LPTQPERQHVDVTFGELSRKLSNPTDINESDIFVAYMLALWSSEDGDSATTEIHVEGVIAIMRHVARLSRDFSTSPMAPFWALLRDEILWLTRKSKNPHRMCQDFREIIGPKTVHQRQSYENELRKGIAVEFQIPDAKVFFGRCMYTSVHTMIEAGKIISQYCPALNPSQDPLIESLIVELHVEQFLVAQKKHEPLLDLELKPLQIGEYVEDWNVELTIIDRLHDLIVFNVCRLATTALEGTTIQRGLRSLEGISASKSLVSILHKTGAFFLSGIHDGRVFGTGIILHDR
jgi:hypothetical protein